jgi:hypothetical protein
MNSAATRIEVTVPTVVFRYPAFVMGDMGETSRSLLAHNATRTAETLARIEALYTEIDTGRDNGGKHYTRADVAAMRREVEALRATLR